jgi:hypothetical protein
MSLHAMVGDEMEGEVVELRQGNTEKHASGFPLFSLSIFFFYFFVCLFACWLVIPPSCYFLSSKSTLLKMKSIRFFH